MFKEIDITDVPLTPRGVNHDFRAVREYEFVRVDKILSWRTLTLIGGDSAAHSDISDNEEVVNLLADDNDFAKLLSSPMVEVRKKKKNLEQQTDNKFNPVNNEVMDTSRGWHNNYEKNKRKTIAAFRGLSATPRKSKSRKSLPLISVNKTSDSENIPPNIDNTADEEGNGEICDANIDREVLNLLQLSLNESRPLINSEYNRLSAAITDWKHILSVESNIPPDSQGNIQSTIGRTQILLDKRFKSTLDVIDKADIYINNNGVLINEGDKEYKPGDIYGFVDLLINEIKKIDSEFQQLLNIRENNWAENNNDDNDDELVNNNNNNNDKVNVIKKKKLQPKKIVKSRIDIKSLRKNMMKKKEGDGDVVELPAVSYGSPPAPRRSLRDTVRSNSVIKSTTGTPVHYDTPRPSKRKSGSVTSSNFLVPTISSSLSNNNKKNKKRSLDNAQFVAPVIQSKKARQSEI